MKQLKSSDFSKIENNSLNSKQLDFMFRKTPKEQIYTRPAKGGGVWSYVTGTYVKKVLNMMFGWDWDFEIVEFKYDLTIKQVYVLGKLKCRSNGKEIIKMQFGRKDIICKKGTDIPLDLGNDLKAASTDALKKCANELGIASDVYSPNEFKEIEVIDDTNGLPELIQGTKEWVAAVDGLNNLGFTVSQLKKRFTISNDDENELLIIEKS